jgi:hypothetical protein
MEYWNIGILGKKSDIRTIEDRKIGILGKD